MRKSDLHTSCVIVDGPEDDPLALTYRSRRPHAPTRACWGTTAPCPEYDNGPDCEHVHRTSRAALTCSRNREIATLA